MGSAEKARVVEAIEAALRVGNGRVNVFVDDTEPSPRPLPHPDPLPRERENRGEGDIWRFSTDLHCPDCDIHYSDPTPSRFSFNSPIGACDTCRGFGRVIGVDFGLVIPDESKSLAGGAVKPFRTKSFEECQDDIEKFAKKRGIPLDIPFRDLKDAHKHWVLHGDEDWGQLEEDRQDALVRHPGLLRLAGDQGVQDAHPCAAVEVPRVHAVRCLRGRSAEADFA